MGRWSDTMNLRHIRAVDYMFEAVAGTVAYAIAIFLYALYIMGGERFQVLQPLFFPMKQDSFAFVLLAFATQFVEDQLAKALLRERVGMVPNRFYGRFGTNRTLSWVISAGGAGSWFSTVLMMLAQWLSEEG